MSTISKPLAQQIAYSIAAFGMLLYNKDMIQLNRNIGSMLRNQLIDNSYQHKCKLFFADTNDQLRNVGSMPALIAHYSSCITVHGTGATALKNDLLIKDVLQITLNEFPCDPYIDMCGFVGSSLSIHHEKMVMHTAKQWQTYHKSLVRIDDNTTALANLVVSCITGMSQPQLKEQFPLLHTIMVNIKKHDKTSQYVARLTESQYSILQISLANHLAVRKVG